MLLVTGGAGFIGVNFVRAFLEKGAEGVVNLDKLTYAARRASLAPLEAGRRHVFVQGDVCDRERVRALLGEHRPRAIVHFAAESHVDRSIAGPAAFVQTNVVGTFSMLEEARAYWERLPGAERDAFLARVEKKSAADAPLQDTGREDVYVQWLHDQFARQAGAELLTARLASFRLLPVLRQTQPTGVGEARRKRPVGGPDAVLAGTLRVTDAPVFAQWLARGVGRHRAFGFGLLLLRPAGR